MPPEHKHEQEASLEPVEMPVEVEVYIEADGTVTFADLAAEVVPIAHHLNPEQPLACEPDYEAGGANDEAEEDAQDD